MYTIPNKRPYTEIKKDLIENHDKLKNHTFREKFQDKFNEGTFKSLLKDYKNLIYKTTENISHIAYYCSDESPITIDDTFWIHDFRSMLFIIDNVFIYDKAWLHKYEEKLNSTIYDFYKNQGYTDINNIMIFFDRYIGYLHQFIESDIFEKIAAIEHEVYASGWYLRHMVDYHKIDGKWISLRKKRD